MATLADAIAAGLYASESDLSLSDRMLRYFSRIHAGEGPPEGEITADVGSSYVDVLTGEEYKKVSGSGDTGWQSSIAVAGLWPDATYITPTGLILTTNLQTADRLLFTPIWVPEDGNIVEFVVDVTSQGVDGTPTIRGGLYGVDELNRPADLLDDFGTVTAVGTGYKTIVTDLDVTRGLYYGATVAQGATTTQPTLRALTGNSPFINPTSLSSGGFTAAYRQNTIAGALPSTATPAVQAPVVGAWFALKKAA